MASMTKRSYLRPYKCWCGSRFKSAQVAEKHLAAKHDGQGVIRFLNAKAGAPNGEHK